MSVFLLGCGCGRTEAYIALIKLRNGEILGNSDGLRQEEESAEQSAIPVRRTLPCV